MKKEQPVGKAYGSKRAIPRHRTQSRVSSAAQERAIERQLRQAAKKELKNFLMKMNERRKYEDIE